MSGRSINSSWEVFNFLTIKVKANVEEENMEAYSEQKTGLLDPMRMLLIVRNWEIILRRQ